MHLSCGARKLLTRRSSIPNGLSIVCPFHLTYHPNIPSSFTRLLTYTIVPSRYRCSKLQWKIQSHLVNPSYRKTLPHLPNWLCRSRTCCKGGKDGHERRFWYRPKLWLSEALLDFRWHGGCVTHEPGSVVFDIDRVEECDAPRDQRVGEDSIVAQSGGHAEARREDH